MMDSYIKNMIFLFFLMVCGHSVQGTDLYRALDESPYEVGRHFSIKKSKSYFDVQEGGEIPYTRKIEDLEEWSIRTGHKVGAIGGGLLGLGFTGITLGLGIIVFPGFWYGGKAFGGYMGYQFSKKHGPSFINYIYGYDEMIP
jgi:hypothetical protein